MVDTPHAPSKQARRELPRWKRLLEMREQGLSIRELANLYDISESQVYELLSRAKKAREDGWF